ncbi:MAG: hypothetical protein AB1568_10240 [Thermodesulfobacteriota bacterium]
MGDHTATNKEIGPAELAATGALLLYFLFKLCWFAIRIGPDIFPDEVTWFGISRLFSHSLLPPADSPASYQYGLITTVPTLYFWLMGKLLALNVTPLDDLIFLRFCNIVIALATLHFGWHLARTVMDHGAARLLFLAMLTNTLMFTFLSASVSYDNLTNMLAAMAIYYAVRFRLERNPHLLLLCLAGLFLGGLTKLAFLPFAFLVLAGLLALEWRNLSGFGKGFAGLFTQRRPLALALLALLLVSGALNVKLYLGNLVRYSALQPQMDRVVGLEAALQYRIFARDYIANQFRSGAISYTEAVRMTALIKHEGDRQGALYLLQDALRQKTEGPEPRLDRFHYAFVWTELMGDKIFGIMAHKNLFRSDRELALYSLIFLLALACCLRRFTAADLRTTAPLLLGVAGGYTLIVMQLVNYRTYLGPGIIDLALQGRYLFPVLVPFLLTAAHYLTPRAGTLRGWLTALPLIAFFIAMEFPWFLRNVTPDWFF